MSDYQDFLASKVRVFSGTGIAVAPEQLHPSLFSFQRRLIRWALLKGRSAQFWDTGLGKTYGELAWAEQIPGRVILFAPLSVAQQTCAIAASIGVEAHYARNEAQSRGQHLTVANYEMLPHFEPGNYSGVILDEASILKAYDGATTRALIDAFRDTPYRLACTATPAPNDVQEFANHAEFLGIMTRREMLATFFVHDDAGWRLKGHARQPFYRWLASWAMSIGKPSDIGCTDAGYDLPPLTIEPVIVGTAYVPDGQLFATGLKGVGDRAKVRKGTLAARVEQALTQIRAGDGQCIVWCGLNPEQDAIARALGDTCVSIDGRTGFDERLRLLDLFLSGERQVLVSKIACLGFGMNFQNAARQVFVGLGDSYEQYYQGIRRSWRFGQTRPVHVAIVLSDLEQPIYANVLRKEAEAAMHQQELISNVIQYERAEIASARQTEAYTEDAASGPGWELLLGDSVERLAAIADGTIDLSVYSPPFASLFTYSNSDRDLGNSATRADFFAHYAYIVREVLRVTRPGRNTAVHVQQIASTLAHDGVIGLTDFRGDVIRAYAAEGWIYHGEVCIDKDPQAQAIRTHSKSLLFVQLHRDASWLRPALADYILLFRKPGENAVPVHPDVSNEEWIEFARPIWRNIRESNTLNVAIARENNDERHLCPLQLETIERCIRLWSNPKELILDPFNGVGSTGVVALKHDRRYIGIELKESYWRTACNNLRRVDRDHHTPSLFDLLPEEVRE